jgi:hypothetical protein
MALRVSSATQGAMRADGVHFGAVPGGRITLLVWHRATLISRTMRTVLQGQGTGRITTVLGTGATLVPRFTGTDDAGVAIPTYTFNAGLALPVDTWAPVAMSYSNELATLSHRCAALRPGLAFNGPAIAFTSYLSFAGLRHLVVGRDQWNTGSMYPGDYSHVALWNERLGDKELDELMSGENPLAIRRASLVGYWPLERDGRNLVQPAVPLREVDALGPVWVDGPARIAKTPVGRVYYRRSKAPSAVAGLAFRASLAGAAAAAAATREGQRVAMREAGFRGLQRTLEAAFPTMPLERNRRAPIDDREELPRLVLRDGGHEASNQDAAEEAAYTVTATVEAYAKGGDDTLLGETLNDLHARIVAALVGHEIAIDLEGRSTWALEDTLELDDAPASQAEYHIGALYLTLRFELRWPTGTGPFSTI